MVLCRAAAAAALVVACVAAVALCASATAAQTPLQHTQKQQHAPKCPAPTFTAAAAQYRPQRNLLLNDKACKEDTELPQFVFFPGMGACLVELRRTQQSLVPEECYARSLSGEVLPQDVWWTHEPWNPTPSVRFSDPRCMKYYLELSYDQERDEFVSPYRTEMRTKGVFGDISVILDTIVLPDGTRLINTHDNYTMFFFEMEQRFGLLNGEKLFVTPYDFRLGVRSLAKQGWFSQVQHLIEVAVTRNHGMPAVLMGHSMGAPLTYMFLRAMTQEWREKYVAVFLSVSGGFAGQLTDVFGVTFDMKGGVYIPGKEHLQDELRLRRTFESFAWNLPGGNVLTEVPVAAVGMRPSSDAADARPDPAEYFMRSNFSLFLDRAVGIEPAPALYRLTNHVGKDVEVPPGVDTVVLDGVGYATPVLIWWHDFNVTRLPYAVVESFDGDGLDSSWEEDFVVKKWREAQKAHDHAVQEIRLNADHMHVMYSENAVGLIERLLLDYGVPRSWLPVAGGR